MFRTGVAYVIKALVLAAFAIGALNLISAAVVAVADHIQDRQFAVPERWAQLPVDANREAWLQTWLPWWDRTRTQYEPYIGFVLRPMQTALVTVGEHGYRTHRHRTPEGSATRRITLYGSSQIWGSALADNETIAAQLEGMLAAARVENHALRGVSSRTTFQAMTNDLLRGERPDVIVMVNGAIDVERGCRNGDPAAITDGEVLEMARRLERGAFYGLFLPTETLADRVRWSIASEDDVGQTPDCAADSNRAQEVARRLFATWEDARALAALRGARFLAVIEHSPYFGNTDTSHFRDAAAAAARRRNMEAVYAALRRRLDAGSHPWIFDLSGMMEGMGQVYVDPGGHLVPRAATAFARRLATLIDAPPAAGVGTAPK